MSVSALVAILLTAAGSAQNATSVPPSSGPGNMVTFTRDLAPVLFEHCAPCHRPGGSASFSLLTFADARPRARQLATVTASRTMPPWQPEPGHGDFVDERRLTNQEIALFRRWLDSGMPEGAPRDLPRVPIWPLDWQLGPPDLVVTMPAYTLRASGPDLFRNFVLRVPTDTLRYVRAWEFRPGNPRVVHHATLQIDSGGASRRYDEQDDQAGYEGLVAPSARAPDGFFLDWAPGHRPQVSPDEIGWPLPPSSDLVMMLHLRPSGREESVQASVALYFRETPPARTPVMLRLTRQDFDIPAGDRQFTVSDSYTLPVDLDVYTVQPHAHYLARDMRGVARLPDGTTRSLLYIRRWDFDWQDVYRYITPVALPAGTALTMTYRYDNSADNRRNPSRPPKRVGYGQQTSDEMAEMWFQVVPHSDRDRDALKASLASKVMREEVKGRRVMLAKDETNVALHDDLAVLLAELGELEAAADAFRATLRLTPDSAAARYNVGAALVRLGRQGEARRYFDQTLAVDPGHAMAHFNIALLLHADGDRVGALGHYRATLAAEGLDADIRLGAAVALAQVGNWREGAGHVRAVLRARPDWPDAPAALAWILAVASDAGPDERAEAVRLAELAVTGTRGTNAMHLDVLATALAAAGQFDRAIATEEAALQLASNSDASTRSAMQRRLELFLQRRGYQEP